MNVWEGRWRDLRRQGFDRDKAETVYRLLDDLRAFNSRTIAASARRDLETVYEEEPDEGTER